MNRNKINNFSKNISKHPVWTHEKVKIFQFYPPWEHPQASFGKYKVFLFFGKFQLGVFGARYHCTLNIQRIFFCIQNDLKYKIKFITWLNIPWHCRSFWLKICNFVSLLIMAKIFAIKYSFNICLKANSSGFIESNKLLKLTHFYMNLTVHWLHSVRYYK